MNHYSLEVIGRDHELDLLKEAEHRQLANLVTADQQSTIAQLLDRLGGLMIKTGGRLQRPSSPQVSIPFGLTEEKGG